MRPAIAVTTLLLGGFATVTQVVLLREVLVVLEGNELSLAISLAAWLVGVGAGAALGGRLADGARRPEGVAAAAVVAMIMLAPGAVLALRYAGVVLGLPAGAVVPAPQALGLCLAVLAPVSLGVGASFAPLARAMASASRVYAIEGVGAVVGGLVATLALVGRACPVDIVLVGGALLGAGSAWLLARGSRRGAAIATGLLSVGLAISVIAGGGRALDRWSGEGRWASLDAPGRRLDAVDSPYQHLDLAELDGQMNLYANGTPLLSFPDPWTRAAPIHVAMTQAASAPERVLLVGGGAADRVAAVLAHEPTAVELVELDPAELAIARAHLPAGDLRALSDRRVRVVHGDGRRYLSAAAAGAYDLIIVEAPDPTTARSNRYHTEELLEACARALSPEGVLATRIGGAVNYVAGEAGAPAASLLAGLDRVFGHVALWPDQTIRLYASRAEGVVTDDAAELARRWAERSGGVEGFSEHRFDGLFRGDAVAAARTSLRRRTVARNTDAHPVAYLYGLVLWDQRARGASQPSPLWSARWVDSPWLLLPLVLLAVVRLFHGRRRRSVATDGLVLATVGGFAGLAVEVVLLLAYQNVAGSLYRSLGMLVAAFMAGLAAGTVGSARICRVRDLAGIRTWALVVSLATAAVACSTLLVPLAGDLGGLAAGCCLVLAGLCTGATFPPAVALLRAGLGPKRGGRAAGLADAGDHVGASVGAVTVGLVILPAAGLAGTATTVAVLVMLSLAGLVRRVPADALS